MLADCITQDRSAAELFMVRQGTAATMAKAVRDRFTQAVLSIDETIVDGDGTLDEVLDNENFKIIVASLGAGFWLDGSSESISFDLDRLRYGKIVVAFDDGPEGIHIRTQVVSLLTRFMFPVVASDFVSTPAINPSEGMSEVEFSRAIMSPQTRNLLPIVF
jgi:DNA gyrase/topoisomerase IV subunit B